MSTIPIRHEILGTMFTLSLIAVIAFLVLPFVGSWLSARTLRSRIEFILCVRHQDFLRSLKLGRVEPVVPDDADAPSDHLIIDGVVQPFGQLIGTEPTLAARGPQGAPGGRGSQRLDRPARARSRVAPCPAVRAPVVLPGRAVRYRSRPDSASADEGADRSGLWLRSHGDSLRVLEVAPKSAAAYAGIRRDQRVMQINGRAIAEQHLSQWRELLRGPAGNEVRVLIEGEQQPRVLKLAERLPTRSVVLAVDQ